MPRVVKDGNKPLHTACSEGAVEKCELLANAARSECVFASDSAVNSQNHVRKFKKLPFFRKIRCSCFFNSAVFSIFCYMLPIITLATGWKYSLALGLSLSELRSCSNSS